MKGRFRLSQNKIILVFVLSVGPFLFAEWKIILQKWLTSVIFLCAAYVRVKASRSIAKQLILELLFD